MHCSLIVIISFLLSLVSVLKRLFNTETQHQTPIIQVSNNFTRLKKILVDYQVGVLL